MTHKRKNNSQKNIFTEIKNIFFEQLINSSHFRWYDANRLSPYFLYGDCECFINFKFDFGKTICVLNFNNFCVSKMKLKIRILPLKSYRPWRL